MAMKRRGTKFAALILCLVMIIGSAMPAFAAAPAKEKVEYEGKGSCE